MRVDQSVYRIYYHIPVHPLSPRSEGPRHSGADCPHTARPRKSRGREDRMDREPRPTCPGTVRSRHTGGQLGCSARCHTATLPPHRRRPGRRTRPTRPSTERGRHSADWRWARSPEPSHRGGRDTGTPRLPCRTRSNRRPRLNHPGSLTGRYTSS